MLSAIVPTLVEFRCDPSEARGHALRTRQFLNEPQHLSGAEMHLLSGGLVANGAPVPLAAVPF